MKVYRTALPEVLVLEPNVFRDDRGFFMETFKQRAFCEAIGREVAFVQDNHARSTRGVLRGLHYQLPPHAQGKLARVTSGRVFDVAVDIRRASASFGRWVGFELTAEDHRQIWIPPGFAHGYLVLSSHADFLYRTTDYFEPQTEGAIRWNDPALAIDWPTDGLTLTLSAKDLAAPLLADANVFD